MNTELSPNTQAILLLTAPLIAGKAAPTESLLKPSEYKRLARVLRDLGGQPADLIGSDGALWREKCEAVIPSDRLEQLLTRGFLLSQVVEDWQRRAIWVVSRADPAYPRRLKQRLRDDAPPILYGCGRAELLNCGGLAVVGSRRADGTVIDYTRKVGDLAAQAECAVISGGARGVDEAAMFSALDAGGNVAGVLADSLEKKALNRTYRKSLLDGSLVLISPYDPKVGFQVGHAMQRNKVIYALADAALIVSADLGKGGTWAGAVEHLEKHKSVRVYVHASVQNSEAMAALQEKGALLWPEPNCVANFLKTLRCTESISSVAPAEDAASTSPVHSDSVRDVTVNEAVALADAEAPEVSSMSDANGEAAGDAPHDQGSPGPSELPDERAEPGPRLPAEIVFEAVRTAVIDLIQVPMKDSEVADALDVSKAQAKVWLDRLVDEGRIEKRSRPVRYAPRSGDLFD